jgi:hypothetical protein
MAAHSLPINMSHDKEPQKILPFEAGGDFFMKIFRKALDIYKNL